MSESISIGNCSCIATCSHCLVSSINYTIFVICLLCSSHLHRKARTKPATPSARFAHLHFMLSNVAQNSTQATSHLTPESANHRLTSSMDMEMEIDPEIAAQMGFGSFGGASKKRKFNPDDAFTGATNSNIQEPQQFASKANAVPVAESRPRKNDDTLAAGECAMSACSSPPQKSDMRLDNARDNLVLSDGTTVNLQALRRGVRNERGDMAYFLPSFLEDPWEKLKSKQA